MGAWYLLMLLSFVLVTLVHKPEAARAGGAPKQEGRDLGRALPSSD
jgi:hypothetical protein